MKTVFEKKIEYFQVKDFFFCSCSNNLKQFHLIKMHNGTV